MKIPELRVQGTVTTATVTALTVTPSVDTMDKQAGGAIATVVVNGTGLGATGVAVGDRVEVRITSR
jgi:hypothetical protein